VSRNHFIMREERVCGEIYCKTVS